MEVNLYRLCVEDEMIDLSKTKKLIIFGAGKIGRKIYDVCIDRGIEVVGVWDNYPEKVVAFHKKNLISIPPDLSGEKTAADYDLENIDVLVTVFSHNMSALLAKGIMNKGFGTIIYDRSDISSILIEHCNWLAKGDNYKIDYQDCFICPARRDENVECDRFNRETRGDVQGQSGNIVFPVLGFLLTTNCNLTCVGCNHLRDHFDKCHNINFDSKIILGDLRKLLGAIDFVKSLVIAGGEALMHPDFEEILIEVLKMPKIGFIQLITNGTVMPKRDSIFEMLSDSRVIVEVSGYGNEPGSPRVKKREKFFERMSIYGITYRYDEATQWIDFGGFERRDLTDQEWIDNYRKCCFVSNDLFNGQLHKCSRSAYGNYLGKIPDLKKDYVDIRALPYKELRVEISNYLGMKPEVCRYCDGASTRTISAGVQVSKKF